MAHADYSVIGGKLVIYMKKTLQLGEGPYICSFVYSFAFIRSFVDVRSSMLSIGGRGMLLNAIYPCWIDRCLIGDSVVAVIVKGYR